MRNLTSMTTSTPFVLRAVRRAVLQAMLSPSTYNTEPWRFTIESDSLDLHAAPGRRVPVIDPDSRQEVMSCGAALLAARLSLAASGIPVTVDLLPDPARPDHLARLNIGDGRRPPDRDAAALDDVARDRHTNRQPLTDRVVRDQLISEVEQAAHREGATLRRLSPDRGASVAARANAEAEELLLSDPRYRGELAEWAVRATPAPIPGAPARAFPPTRRTADGMPIRGLPPPRTAGAPGAAPDTGHGCLLLLTTDTDDRADWLRAGQGLGRALLEATRLGVVAGMFAQLTEVPRIRQTLRRDLDLPGYPQLLLQLGYAARTSSTPRRPVADVLTVAPDPRR